jgi:hypothetical protein
MGSTLKASMPVEACPAWKHSPCGIHMAHSQAESVKLEASNGLEIAARSCTIRETIQGLSKITPRLTQRMRTEIAWMMRCMNAQITSANHCIYSNPSAEFKSKPPAHLVISPRLQSFLAPRARPSPIRGSVQSLKTKGSIGHQFHRYELLTYSYTPC